VLVVEDDPQVARQIEATLVKNGYAVDVAQDGERGGLLAETEPYDAVVLDLGLPMIDGLTLLRRWREKGYRMPVLVLTARDTWRDKVTGLRAGADDYLSKPFEPEEMVARIEALIRRASGHASPVLECGPVALDTSTKLVTLNGSVVELTAMEFRGLSYLMHNAGRVISKTELIEHLYGQDFDGFSNVIEVLVNRLRKKLGTDLIKTHRGLGYQLVVPVNAS
jgi:two-component system OmpR family response regulator